MAISSGARAAVPSCWACATARARCSTRWKGRCRSTGQARRSASMLAPMPGQYVHAGLQPVRHPTISTSATRRREGQAYLVGGFNVSYLRRGNVVLIPIPRGCRAGRLGVNAGYIRFSHKQRWLPF